MDGGESFSQTSSELRVGPHCESFVDERQTKPIVPVKAGPESGLREHLMEHVALGIRAAYLEQIVLDRIEQLDHLSVIARVEVAYGVVEIHAQFTVHVA